jgi:hypothetical protein
MAGNEDIDEHRFEHGGRSLTLRRNARDADIIGVFEDGEELLRIAAGRQRPLEQSEAHVRDRVDKGGLMTPQEALTHPPFDELMGPFTDCPELDALAFRMFREFSRFEYALKAAGRRPQNGDAKADWGGFAGEIDPAFQDRVGKDRTLRTAVNYFVAKPPKKERVVDNALVWKATPAGGANSTDDLLIYVRRVRNNLFHGGKYSRNWLDPERSEPLIRHSLTILSACLELSPEVRAAYEH